MGDGAHLTSLTNRIHCYIKTIGGRIANIPMFLLSDVDGRVAWFDPVFKVPVFNTTEHAEAHEKDSFISGFADLAMGNSDTLIIAFKAPAGTKRVHLIYAFDTLVGCHVDCYKDSTWDAETGSLLPIYNRFQEDTPESSVLLENQAQAGFVASDNLIVNPTNYVVGTKIRPTHYAFGSQSKAVGAIRATEELILDVNTLHSIVLTADGAANKGQLMLFWYEHLDE